MPPPPAPRPATVTLADLVVLSLLCEGPRHGYDLWAELERRQVEKWASISRPQVYYSLRKLAAAKHIVSSRDDDASQGPERRVYKPSESGRRMLADALAQARWSTQRPPDPFLTWMVLSWQARPRDFSAQIARRRKFLEQQLEEDRAALDAVSRRDLAHLRRGVRRETWHQTIRNRARLARRRRGAAPSRVSYSGCGEGRCSARRSESRISLPPRCRRSLARRTPVSSGCRVVERHLAAHDARPLTSDSTPQSVRAPLRSPPPARRSAPGSRPRARARNARSARVSSIVRGVGERRDDGASRVVVAANLNRDRALPRRGKPLRRVEIATRCAATRRAGEGRRRRESRRARDRRRPS